MISFRLLSLKNKLFSLNPKKYFSNLNCQTFFDKTKELREVLGIKSPTHWPTFVVSVIGISLLSTVTVTGLVPLFQGFLDPENQEPHVNVQPNQSLIKLPRVTVCIPYSPIAFRQFLLEFCQSRPCDLSYLGQFDKRDFQSRFNYTNSSLLYELTLSHPRINGSGNFYWDAWKEIENPGSGRVVSAEVLIERFVNKIITNDNYDAFVINQKYCRGSVCDTVTWKHVIVDAILIYFSANWRAGTFGIFSKFQNYRNDQIEKLFWSLIDVICDRIRIVADDQNRKVDYNDLLRDGSRNCKKLIKSSPDSIQIKAGEICLSHSHLRHIGVLKNEIDIEHSKLANPKEIWKSIGSLLSFRRQPFGIYSESDVPKEPDTSNSGELQHLDLYNRVVLHESFESQQIQLYYWISVSVDDKKTVNCYNGSSLSSCVVQCCQKNITNGCSCVPYFHDNSNNLSSYCNDNSVCEKQRNKEEMTTTSLTPPTTTTPTTTTTTPQNNIKNEYLYEIAKECRSECGPMCTFNSYQWRVIAKIDNEEIKSDDYFRYDLPVSRYFSHYVQILETPSSFVQITKEKPSFMKFVADVGGVAGLWLGVSAFSLFCELMNAFIGVIERIILLIRRKRQENTAGSETQTDQLELEISDQQNFQDIRNELERMKREIQQLTVRLEVATAQQRSRRTGWLTPAENPNN